MSTVKQAREAVARAEARVRAAVPGDEARAQTVLKSMRSKLRWALQAERDNPYDRNPEA